MRRRKLRLGLCLAGLAAVAVGIVVLWPGPERVTRENYDRIHGGMTRAEVEAILGPPGDYRTGVGMTKYGTVRTRDNWMPDPNYYDPAIAKWRDAGENPLGQRRGEAIWVGDTLCVWVVADDTGRVLETYTSERRRMGNALDRLLWSVGRQWHRWFPEW